MLKIILFVFMFDYYFCESVNHFNVDFKKIVRRQLEVKDFTKLEIKARPLLMFTAKDSLTTKNIAVELREGKGKWQKVETKPKVRAGVFKWTLSDLNPCKEKEVKLVIHKDDENEESFIYPHIIEAPSMDEISHSGYRPKMPESLTVIEEPRCLVHP